MTAREWLINRLDNHYNINIGNINIKFESSGDYEKEENGVQ